MDLWGPLGTAGDRWGRLGTAGDGWGSVGIAWGSVGTLGMGELFSLALVINQLVLRGNSRGAGDRWGPSGMVPVTVVTARDGPQGCATVVMVCSGLQRTSAFPHHQLELQPMAFAATRDAGDERTPVSVPAAHTRKGRL